MKKLLKVIIGVLIILIVSLCVLMYMTGPTDSKDNTNIVLNVGKNDTYSTLGSVLYEKGLVRSELIYKVYVKLFLRESHLEIGEYNLNKTMGLDEIFEILRKGNNYNPDVIRITFKEGLNARSIARLIANNTNNSYEDVIRLLADEIKSQDIYYPLEGYLFPDTYEFLNRDVKTETIIRTLLSEFGEKIKPYKEEIDKSKFTLNEIVILASIAELESLPGSDRRGVVGVFVNRIENNISLGSDMTAYYAYKLDDIRKGLTLQEFQSCTSPYNTRCNSKMGLPVGAISNPGFDSIIGAIEYENNGYLYFVADCKGKTYFAKSYSEFESTIRNLRNQGLWCEVSA